MVFYGVENMKIVYFIKCGMFSSLLSIFYDSIVYKLSI